MPVNSEVAESKQMAQEMKSRASGRRIILWTVYLLSFAVLVVLFIEGYSYYSTPYAERPRHEDYRIFKPAGSRGLTYGIIGSAMMLLMLVYSLQKRLSLFGKNRTLRPFLDFHIYMGVIGPLFIVLHTSFKVQGLVAVSFWSMVAVALSGYFGRYLYRQIPRNIQDNELSLSEMEESLEAQTRLLKEQFGIEEEKLKFLSSLFEQELEPRGKGTVMSVLRLLFDDIRRPLIKSHIRRRLTETLNLGGRSFEELYSQLFKRALLHRKIAALSNVQRVFHYWHVIHKPFAIIMYIIMFIHIGVAVWTGYGWVR